MKALFAAFLSPDLQGGAGYIHQALAHNGREVGPSVGQLGKDRIAQGRMIGGRARIWIIAEAEKVINGSFQGGGELAQDNASSVGSYPPFQLTYVSLADLREFRKV